MENYNLLVTDANNQLQAHITVKRSDITEKSISLENSVFLFNNLFYPNNNQKLSVEEILELLK